MTTDPYTATGPMILPSILSADFVKLGAEVEDALAAGGDFLHCDVLDGHFAPNISFGPHVIEAVRRVTPCYLDCHLMISEPVRYAEALVKAGASSLTFHTEAVDDPVATAKELRKRGCRVGVTIRPATPVEAVWPVLDLVDLVLVMSVVPGFSGQQFMPEVLGKCEAVKRRLRPDQRLEIDGGMKPNTIRRAADAGVDWFVVASAIFDKPDRPAAVHALRDALAEPARA
jgi:ribulose-phosphate 3-epimerase